MAAPSISQDIEIWKPIPGYEHYLVSNFGRVARLVKTRYGRRGVPLAGIWSQTGRKHFGIHRLVAMAFEPQSPTYIDVEVISSEDA